MAAASTKYPSTREELIFKEATQADFRCRHKTASGRRCERQPTSVDYGFCGIHAAEAQKFRDAEATAIASELLGCESNFGDLIVVNQVLGKLFTLVAQGRIPVSTAALLTQIGQLLLQGLQGSHSDVRLAEVNNAWRQTIVNVLSSADREGRSHDITNVHYENLGSRIAESGDTGAAVRQNSSASRGEES
jgi:hypothetical protein